MQVNTENIQRPALFSDFFTEEVDYKNDFVSYIDTSSNDRNIVHKGSVTSLLDNSKFSLKTRKFKALGFFKIVYKFNGITSSSIERLKIMASLNNKQLPTSLPKHLHIYRPDNNSNYFDKSIFIGNFAVT